MASSSSSAEIVLLGGMIKGPFPVAYNPRKTKLFRPQNLIMYAFFILGALMTLSIIGCSFSMFMSLSALMLPAPLFYLNSLSVSQFNVTNSTLSANWMIDFTVENTDSISGLLFNHVEFFVSYEDNALAVTSIEPFFLGFKERRNIGINISTTGWEGDQPPLKETVLQKIRAEKETNSSVNVNVEMVVRATYNCSGWSQSWTQSVIMNPNCQKLDVQFAPSSGFGRWFQAAGPKMCLGPMLADS